MQIRKNIGETGLPCRMLAFISLNSLIQLLKDSQRRLDDRKDFAQDIRLIGRLSFFSVSIRRLCATWLKAPLTLKKAVVVTSLSQFQCCIQSTKSITASIADFQHLLPIQEGSRRSKISARSPSRFAIILLLTFPRQLSSVITLYAFKREQLGFNSFLRIAPIACFQYCRWYL